MGSHNTSERRKYPRFSVDLPLEYRVLDAPQAHGGLVINASESGLLVHSTRDIPIGTKLTIAVLFPRKFELANFEVFAEIIWKDTVWIDNREEYQLGIKFIRIMDEEHQKLKHVLAENREMGI